MKKILQHPLFAGSMVMIIGSNAVNFLNYLYHLIMGRMLGPANYGELASLLSLMGLVSIIPASINLVIIKYVSSTHNQAKLNNLISWLKSNVIKSSLVLFALLLLTSPFIASFLHLSKTIYLIIIAVTFLVSFQSIFYRAILQGLLKFKETVISILAENVVKLAASIVLIYLGFRVGGAVFSFLIANTVGWYITTTYLKVKTKKVSELPDVKSMALFALPVALQSFSMTSLYSSDVILIKHFFSAHDAGIYAALSTLGKIIFFATGPIGAVMFPLISNRSAKGEQYKKIFLLSMGATLSLAILILLFYLTLPEFVIGLLYGSLFLEASGLLIWFGLFMALFTLAALIINYQLSLGKGRVVIFPTLAAILQITLVWFYHPSILAVIFISLVTCALLLAALLIYSSYGNKTNIGDRASL